MDSITKRLTCKAPNRCSYETPSGWADRPWTSADMQAAESAGAWFGKGHDFADDVERRVRTKREPDPKPDHNAPILALMHAARKLTPSERILLMAQLEAK